MKKENVKFKFWGSFGQKFKFVGAENLGHAWTNWSIYQKIRIFGERSFLMKCVGIWLVSLIFKIFLWFLSGVKLWVQIWDSQKVFKIDFLAKILSSFMCN